MFAESQNRIAPQLYIVRIATPLLALASDGPLSVFDFALAQHVGTGLIPAGEARRIAAAQVASTRTVRQSVCSNGGSAISRGRRRATLSSKPSARKFVQRLLPPALTNGSGMPVIGARPMFMPMFSSA